jgi:hypothetical protein
VELLLKSFTNAGGSVELLELFDDEAPVAFTVGIKPYAEFIMFLREIGAGDGI